MDRPGRFGVTPLIWAVTCEGIELPSDLSNRIAASGEVLAIKPVAPDYLNALAVLLKAGADPNRPIVGAYGPVYPGTRNPVLDGYSPVLIAAEFRSDAVLRVLLVHGGDPNAQTRAREGFDDRHTALSLAYGRGDWLALSKDLPPFDERQFANFFVLLDAGADLALDTGIGENVLETAAMRRPSFVLGVLRKYPYSGGYDTIVYHAIFRIARKYPGEEDARALLDYLRTEKGVDVDAYWAQYRQNSAPNKE